MGTRQEQASQWLGEVARWRASGLSRAAYCAREGLSVSAFGYWVAKANRGVQAPAPLTLVAGQPQWLATPAPIEASTGGLTLRRGVTIEPSYSSERILPRSTCPAMETITGTDKTRTANGRTNMGLMEK